jgi:hypothetical protein
VKFEMTAELFASQIAHQCYYSLNRGGPPESLSCITTRTSFSPWEYPIKFVDKVLADQNASIKLAPRTVGDLSGVFRHRQDPRVLLLPTKCEVVQGKSLKCE